MDTVDLFQRLSVALAVGLVIGLERGWHQREERDGARAAGLRTHALAGLLGGVWGIIAKEFGADGALALGLAFLTFSAVILLFRLREAAHDRTFGATTVVAAMLAFSLGALAALGAMGASAAGGVAVAALLALKPTLHDWVKRLTWLELRSALMLLAMTFLLLPVLPDRAIDRLGAVNPHEIWLLTVLIALISFVGYVAIKVTGSQRGVALTGLVGGLASSTGTTLTFAKLATVHPEHARLLSGGALVSGATMMARVAVVLIVAKPALAGLLVLPLGCAAGAMALFGIYLVTRPQTGEAQDTELAVSNPLDLGSVLKFGALLTAVGVAAQLATHAAGSWGALAIAALAGLADVDAITLSMARLAGAQLSLEMAAAAVFIAVAVNTLTKSALGWATGGRVFGGAMALAALAAFAAALVGYLLGPVPLDQLVSLAR